MSRGSQRPPGLPGPRRKEAVAAASAGWVEWGAHHTGSPSQAGRGQRWGPKSVGRPLPTPGLSQGPGIRRKVSLPIRPHGLALLRVPHVTRVDSLSDHRTAPVSAAQAGQQDPQLWDTLLKAAVLSGARPILPVGTELMHLSSSHFDCFFVKSIWQLYQKASTWSPGI